MRFYEAIFRCEDQHDARAKPKMVTRLVRAESREAAEEAVRTHEPYVRNVFPLARLHSIEAVREHR